MPIKDWSLYPDNWQEIRAAVLERAGHRCEACGVPNYARGARDLEGKWRDLTEIAGMNSTEGEIAFGGQYPKVIKIVLTVAHLNHEPGDDRLESLKLLCQLCHNRYDAEHRARNAARTRRRKREALTGQGSIFAEGEAD